MQQITISGTVVNDAEKCVDKSGRNYCRFTVSCETEGPNSRTEYTQYRCICYIAGYDALKRKDKVFLTGKLSARLRKDEKGNPYMNLDILIYQADGIMTNRIK